MKTTKTKRKNRQMTKQEFNEKLMTLIHEGMDAGDMSHEELMGALSFQVFAVYMARAHANFDQHGGKSEGGWPSITTQE